VKPWGHSKRTDVQSGSPCVLVGHVVEDDVVRLSRDASANCRGIALSSIPCTPVLVLLVLVATGVQPERARRVVSERVRALYVLATSLLDVTYPKSCVRSHFITNRYLFTTLLHSSV